jgi:uncharacterized integral membrane protein
MKILRWTLFAVIAVAVLAFAIANRGPVTVSLVPLPWAVEAPLYLVVLAGVLGGLVAAALGGALTAARLRRRARRAERQMARLTAAVPARDAAPAAPTAPAEAPVPAPDSRTPPALDGR